MGFTVSSILPDVAVLLNDAVQDNYTNDVLLPYARMAGDKLQLELELNGILVLDKISAHITVPQGTTDMRLAGLIPVDMLEPERMEERVPFTNDVFMPMIARQWEPDILPTDSLRYWVYREENIFFVGCTQDREVKIYYLKRLIDITTVNSQVNLNNGQQYMKDKTAALAARFVGENATRADELEKEAAMDMSNLIRIGVKSKQRTRTRRRPFVLVGRRNWT